MQTDPLSTGMNGNLGSVFVFTHQWEKAIEQLRTSIDLDPNYWFDHYFLGRAYAQKGRFPEAIAAFKQGMSLGGVTEDGPALDTPMRCRAKGKMRRRSSTISRNYRFTNMSRLTILPSSTQVWETKTRHSPGSIALIRSDPIY